MIVGDRARKLLRMGIDRFAGADLAALRSTINHHHHHGIPLVVAVLGTVAGFGAGLSVPDRAREAVHLRQAPTSIDRRNSEVLAGAGVDGTHALPADLAVRLALPPGDIRLTGFLLSDNGNSSDLAWAAVADGHAGEPVVLASRAVVLHDLISYLGDRPRRQWAGAFEELRVQRAISDNARSILAPLARATDADLTGLGPLILHRMSLTEDQREALYSAGLPPVPTDPERQLLFARLARASEPQKRVLYRFMIDNDAQIALTRTSDVLASRYAHGARIVLGLLLDGALDRSVLAAAPSGCDVVLPASCRRKAP